MRSTGARRREARGPEATGAAADRDPGRGIQAAPECGGAGTPTRGIEASNMRIVPSPRGDPGPGGGEVGRVISVFLLALASIAGALTSPAASAPSATPPSPEDTLGISLMQWNYDSWTVPWVPVRGPSPMLAPASNATLMVLACEVSRLERDRLARHLSAQECEHRMAGIRADQDTALIFRLDLRVFDFAGSAGLVRLDPPVSFILEDDRGRQSRALSIERGPVLGRATAKRLRRTYDYHPPWIRGREHLNWEQYDVSWGRNLAVVEHRVRFGRRDLRIGEPLLDASTRWLRLRLIYGRYEWVAMWSFREDGWRDAGEPTSGEPER